MELSDRPVDGAERLPVRDRCNLTNGQLVIWMGQHLVPPHPCYANGVLCLIEGRLDTDRFADAFDAVIDRSDALRTVITEVEGVPVQQVLPELRYRLPVISLADQADPDAAARAWARHRISQPHPLSERLFDAALIDLGPDRTAWYLNAHHLLHDGRSCQLIYERTSDLYRRTLEGTVDEAPEPPSFSTYVALERDARRSGTWREADAFWRRALERTDEPLELYGASSACRSHDEEWATVELGTDRTTALRAWATADGFRSLNVDLSLLGIFSTLVLAYLHKVTGGRRSLSIGMPFHNRGRATLDTIGMIQQVYPLQVEVSADESFATLTAKVLRGLLDIRRHAPEGSGNLTHRAANDVMLNYLPLSFPDFDEIPTHTEFVPKAAADGSHCLMVQVHDLNATGALRVDLICNTGVYGAEGSLAAAHHFLNVVDQFIADPTMELAAIDVLTPRERHHLIVEANGADESPEVATIDHLVAAQAARTPGSMAAEWGKRSITYLELETRANQLAHHLQTVGAGPGVMVGVYAERSLALMVAVLAIFKSGAGYLPLDTTYPADRLTFILEDSRASVLLTERSMPSLACETVGTVVHLDDLPDTLAACPVTAPANEATGDDLAYVIYTSGSSGRPKGAAVPQRALVNVIDWQVHTASALAHPRTLQFSPLSFDVSLQELFATWCAGGTLVLPTCDVRRDPEALVHLLRDARIEQLYAILTPLQRLAEAVDRFDVVPTSLREVFTCGEPVTLSPPLVRFFERLPGCTFQNQYGSSEDLIVTSYTMTGPVSEWPTVPPIGRPLPNTRVCVLDERLHPVPLGVPGEICVGGAQVSLGYLHHDELTAERFVPDPFSDDPSARLFRTGDRARVLPSGDLMFLGRADDQLKLRGFRIEPGEVEAALRDHPLVDEAAVVLREDDPGSRRLVAYLVPAPGWSDSAVPEVHRWLRDRLAPYMVPAAFVRLDALPRTPSGKLDRRALPRPDAGRPELDAAYTAPRRGLERELADIWQLALRVDRVGLDDDFFELGGDSLLALEVVQEVEDLVDRRLPLATLFEAPTIAELSSLLGDADWIPSRRTLVPIRASGSKTPLYFVATASGRRLSDHLDPERPFYTIHPRGFADDAAEVRIEEMAAGYLREIRAVQPHGPYLLGGACMGGQVAFEMARQLMAEGEVVARTIVVESYAPGIMGFAPRHWRGRVFAWVFFNRRTGTRRQVTRTLAKLERSRAGGAVLSAASRVRHLDKDQAPEVADQRLTHAMRDVQRSRIRALLAYSPPPLPSELVVFRGERDDDDIPNLGWDQFATGGIELHEIAGHHESVLHEPQVSRLASELNDCLERSGI